MIWINHNTKIQETEFVSEFSNQKSDESFEAERKLESVQQTQITIDLLDRHPIEPQLNFGALLQIEFCYQSRESYHQADRLPL
jgi:hypothetical protein